MSQETRQEQAHCNNQQRFVFPDVKMIAQQLVKAIYNSSDTDMKHIPYRRTIDVCGGVDTVVDAILSSIDPDIRELEGCEVTVEV
ncbi:hypothetical protein FE257_009312 [Aspergillus nanangensis]|uniref:Uncharacterized protein n=1 Tax=Aspergillus nanangensis TaxID=2582783 RepID=A0AAD4CLP1_ASPNN|nr:hypothetical protein FE257_009312 [Aspergillus nanangensis]